MINNILKYYECISLDYLLSKCGTRIPRSTTFAFQGDYKPSFLLLSIHTNNYYSLPKYFRVHHTQCGTGIAQSVERLATGWTTEGSVFESRWGQESSLLQVIHTDSGVHPMGTGGSFPGGKAAEV
jgi:hypothetical protein